MKIKKSRSLRLNAPGKALLSYLSTGTIAKAIGILVTPIFTRLLGGEQYGSIAFYLSAVGVVSSAMSPLVSGSRIYSVVRSYKNDVSTVVLSGIIPLFMLCGVIYVIMFALSPLLSFDWLFISLLIIQIFFDSVVLLYITAERYNYSHTKVAAVTLSEAVLSPVISLILIRKFGQSYVMRALGLLLPPLFLSAIIVVFATKHAKADKKCAAALLAYGAPLIPLSLITSLGAYIDRLLTAFLLGNAAIAKYSVAHTVGAGLLFAVTALSACFIPWMLRKLDRGETDRIGAVSEVVIILLAAGAVLLISLSPEIMRLFAPPEYIEAVYAVMPIALIAIPSFISSTASAAILHTGSAKRLFPARTASLLTGAVFGLILIPSLRYLGAGLAALLAECVGAAINLLTLKKTGSEGIIRIGNSRLALILLVLICVILPTLYENLALRILALIIPAVTALNVLFSRGDLLLDSRKETAT